MKRVFLIIATLFCLVSCGVSGGDSENETAENFIGHMKLDYADQFSVDYISENISLITIGEEKYILLPKGEDVPENYAENCTVIRECPENIYMASSSAMDFFSVLDELDSVKFTSTKSDDWTIEDVREKIDSGDIEYIGKYSAPDYERLVSENCGIAVENTMIYHKPEVKEQIENLGIPVIIERSSYESHPLGRLEWVKLYGLLTGNFDRAENFFNEKISQLDNIEVPNDNDRKTVAFFYISSNGYVNIRKSGDYISRSIEMAGGKYVFTADDLNTDENALSTMNIEFEAFCRKAKDADIIIYNGTVDGGVDSIEQLVEKSGVLGEFKAVKNGEVWCTQDDMFQQTSCSADIIYEMNRIFSGQTEQLEFFRRLE